jgi:putative PIG3 family NAD(P)H quinone oxidoreductase
MQISENQVLVKVKYSGLNRADLSQKAGNYPAPPGHSQVLGLEVFGIIEKIGANVSGFDIGDEVMALVNGGGYGEFCIVESGALIKRPEYLSQEQCAAIPEVFMTSLLNLVEIGQLNKDQIILIHAGASGVGLASIQLARLIGATVIATVRSENKVQKCFDAGAHHVILQDSIVDYAKYIKDLGLVINLSLNPAGGAYINQDLEIMAFAGKIINIGLMAGSNIEINLSLLLRKNLQLIGSTIRNKPNDVKAKLTDLVKNMVLPAIKEKKIEVVIDRVFAINDVEIAHEYMANNKNTGKILLKH